nr:killer cell lectin-like receptor subfamily F member 1 [Biomphalaria glabrata]
MEKRLRRTMNKSLKTVLFFPVCLLLLLLNDIQAAIAENDINVTCQEGWTKLHRGCYKFVEEETTWTDAVEKCQSVNAELSVLLSQTEKDDVEQYLISNDEINYKRWWVGLTREENTGSNWIWTERDNTRIDTKITPWFQNSQSTKKAYIKSLCLSRRVTADSNSMDYERVIRRLHSADDPLYKQYLQSEINANVAKMAYYTRVAGLYEAALQQQNQYYESSREKLS